MVDSPTLPCLHHWDQPSYLDQARAGPTLLLTCPLAAHSCPHHQDLLYCVAQGRRCGAALLNAAAGEGHGIGSSTLILLGPALQHLHHQSQLSHAAQARGRASFLQCLDINMAQASDIPMAFGVNSGPRYQHRPCLQQCYRIRHGPWQQPLVAQAPHIYLFRTAIQFHLSLRCMNISDPPPSSISPPSLSLSPLSFIYSFTIVALGTWVSFSGCSWKYCFWFLGIFFLVFLILLF